MAASRMENILFDALVDFKEKLSEERIRNFKHVTVKTLQACIVVIQHDQEKIKGMMDFTRIDRFITAFREFEQVMRPFIAGNPDLSDLICCIWGPTKSIIETSKENPAAFDLILETYDKLGDCLPLVAEYESILQEQPEWRICLAWIYEDLLRFNSEILNLFKLPDWAKTFVVNRKDYDTKFESLLNLFDNHKTVLMSALNIQTKGIGTHINQDMRDLAVRQQQRFEEQRELAAQQQEISLDIQQKLNDFMVRNQDNFEELRILVLEGYERFRSANMNDSKEREKHRREDQYRHVVKWLRSPGDPKPEAQYHEEFQRTRSVNPETGKWFLADTIIKTWVEEDIPEYSGLWVNGKKGAGKTILASKMIDHLKDTRSDSKTSYFYCRQTSQQLSEPRVLSILKSLLTQMVADNWDILPTMYDKSMRGGSELKDEQTAQTLLNLFADLDIDRFIVIDGLDELEKADANRIMHILGDTVKKSDEHNQPGRIRVMLFSTDSATMEQYMEVNERFNQFAMRLRSSREDIGLFVSKKFDELTVQFELEPWEVEFAKSEICKNSDGIFLYAHLVVEDLFAQPNTRCLLEELKNPFPKTYEEVYTRILNRLRTTLHHNMWEESKKILGWLAYAKRPLKLYELKAALATSITNQGLVQPQDSRAKLRHDIRDMCGPLVHIIGETRVEFSHHLARDFVMKTENLDPQAVECDLAFHCLHYLSHVSFRKNLPSGSRESYAKKGHYAFQDYAISQWPAHLKTIIMNSANIFNRQADYVTKANIALEAFCKEHKIEPAKFKPEQAELKAKIEEEARKACEHFREFAFYESLLRIWTHLLGHNEQSPKERNLVSIKELRDVLKNNRDVLKELAPELERGSGIAVDLKGYYGINLFKCDRINCAYFYEGFETQEELKSHSNRHDRPFQCPIQNCSFAQFGFSSNKDRDKHNRNYHPNLSDGPSWFIPLNRRIVENAKHACDECGRNFTRKANLDAHVNSAHLGRRPFACSTCSKAFTRKNDCRRHEKLHSRRQK